MQSHGEVGRRGLTVLAPTKNRLCKSLCLHGKPASAPEATSVPVRIDQGPPPICRPEHDQLRQRMGQSEGCSSARRNEDRE